MESKESEIKNKVRTFIKNKRLILGLTQKQFAELVFGDEKKQDWVSKIESGKRGIGIDTLYRILSKLNCDIDFIEY